MKTNKQTNGIRRKIVFFFISFTLCLMQSCSTEDVAIEQQSTIETVSKNEAITFVKNLYDEQRTTAKSSGLQNDFDFDKITQEKLTSTTELLTVIPIKTKIQNQRRRALFLRVGANIESMIYYEFAESSFTNDTFSGIVLLTRLNGDFIRAYRLKNNEYVIDLVPSKKLKSSQKTTMRSGEVDYELGLDEVEVYNRFKISNGFVSLTNLGNEVPISITWDPNYNGGGGSGGGAFSATVVEEMPPSCESFNFVKTAGLWQVALVKNVHFKVFLLNEKGVKILHWVDFPQPISFGTPTNIQMGNTDITPGLAANASARALQKSMQDVIDKYGSSRTSDLTLMLYFQERLKHNYPLYIPGGRVNFNATENIVATEYKTNPWTAGNCN